MFHFLYYVHVCLFLDSVMIKIIVLFINERNQIIFQILLDPYLYICQIPGKKIRGKLALVSGFKSKTMLIFKMIILIFLTE